MKINFLKIKNFRSIVEIPKIEFSNLTVFIGKNDAGKSNILLALDRFFKGSSFEEDLNKKNKQEGVVEVCFQLNEEEKIYLDATKVGTTLLQENLLNSDNNLDIIMKIGRQKKPAIKYFLRVLDFDNGTDFCNLAQKSEEELNSILIKYKLSFSEEGGSVKSGKGRENKRRREMLRKYAIEKDVNKKEQEILLNEESSSGLRNEILRLINTVSFNLYPGNTPLEVAESENQSKFKPLIELVIGEKIPDGLEKNINNGLQKEIDEIQSIFQKDTGMDLRFKSSLGRIEWRKSIKPTVLTEEDDLIISLDKRGLGTQRLFIMAMFRYLAERLPKIKERKFNHFLFAIEEPEAFLHNDLQRKFFYSMQELSKSGPQIILTTHSPTFSRNIKNLAVYLVTFNNKEGTKIKNIDIKNNYPLIKEELGIWNNDVFFDNAFVCIEGDTEEKCFPYIFEKLNCSILELGIRVINLRGQNKIDKDKIKELFNFAKDHNIKVFVFLDDNQENNKTKDDICREYKELFLEKDKDKLFKIWSKNFADCFNKKIVLKAVHFYFNNKSFVQGLVSEINSCNNNIENKLKNICYENKKGDFNKPYFGKCIGKALCEIDNTQCLTIEPIKAIDDMIKYLKTNL